MSITDSAIAAIRRRLSELERKAEAAWTSFTPSIDQNGDVTKTINYAKYKRVGKTVHVTVQVSITGSGSGGNFVIASLPFAAPTSSAARGGAHIYDQSTGTRYVLRTEGWTADTIVFVHDTSGGSFWGAGPNVGLASGDVLDYSMTYEAA